MSSHNVEYQISLKDILSGKIKEAEGHVNHFEHTLEHTRDIAKEMAGAAVGFFGLYQGVEFIKGSVEAYNSVEKSLSQLKAGLESTGGAAGVTYEELTEGAERFAASTIYNKEVLLDMQAQLLSFPEITKENFEGAEQAIMDLATRTGHSLHDVSIMVGKALGDPTKGITALRRVGVEFSESQTKVIQKLAETGHAAKAQQMILKELGREYSGSTAAASATAGGQMEILKHQFDEVKESVGKLVMEETLKLAPTIKKLIEEFKHLVEWVDKNKDTIVEVTKAVVEVTAAMWAFGKTRSAIMGIASAWGSIKAAATAAGFISTGSEAVGAEVAATGAAAGGAESVTVALLGSAGVAAAVTSLVAGIIAAPWFMEKLSWFSHNSDRGERDVYNASGVVKSEMSAYDYQLNNGGKTEVSSLQAVQNILKAGGLDVSLEELKKSQNEFTANISKINKNLPDGSKYSEDMLPNIISAFKDSKEISPADLDKFVHKYSAPVAAKSDKKIDATLSAAQSSVTGQQIKNIYITIHGGLVHDFTVKTVNLKEATPDIKRIITETLTDAINDSEINN